MYGYSSYSKMIIDVFSHNFTVKAVHPRDKQLVADFSKRFIKYENEYNHFLKHYERKPICVFAAATRDRSIVRYHINVFSLFMNFLDINKIPEYCYIVNRHNPNDIEWNDVQNILAPGWSPRENQLDAIDYVLDPNELHRIKLVTLGTGTGKTFISLYTAVQKSIRFVLIVKPQYIDRWLDGVKNIYDIKTHEIMTIVGSESLKCALSLGEDALKKIKVIIISNKTFQNYLVTYEKNGDNILEQGWTSTPEQYAARLGARWVYIDESHQDFHLNFKITLYTHCERMVSSTATFMPDDPFIKKIANIAFPPETRFNPQPDKKYIAGAGVFYRLTSPKNFKRCIKKRGYSHTTFEKLIMSNKNTETNYYELIYDILNSGYLKIRKPGYKCAIYVATINMATRLKNFLRNKIPDNISIERYVGPDPTKNLLDPDIRITTIKSSGTAIDIPGLSCVIMTIALSGTQANIQLLGRLREMKDGTTPLFFWFNCLNIDKHMEYHYNKINNIFRQRLIDYRDIDSGSII